MQPTCSYEVRGKVDEWMFEVVTARAGEFKAIGVYVGSFTPSGPCERQSVYAGLAQVDLMFFVQPQRHPPIA